MHCSVFQQPRLWEVMFVSRECVCQPTIPSFSCIVSKLFKNSLPLIILYHWRLVKSTILNMYGHIDYYKAHNKSYISSFYVHNSESTVCSFFQLLNQCYYCKFWNLMNWFYPVHWPSREFTSHVHKDNTVITRVKGCKLWYLHRTHGNWESTYCYSGHPYLRSSVKTQDFNTCWWLFNGGTV